MFWSPPKTPRHVSRLVSAASLAIGCVIIVLSLLASPARADTVIHVDADAAGAGTGLSWTDAFTNIQDALAIAGAGDQIWVAEGVYYPDEGGGLSNGAQTATFQLIYGVALYGGFNGTETQLDLRDPGANLTVLSGDIDNNDLTAPSEVVTDTANIVGANAYHVVSGGGADSSGVLDGFTITAGKAVFPYDRGGGMFNEGSSPTLNDLIFSGNRADNYGGGIYNDGSSPTLTGVDFSGNSAGSGGGMANNNGSAPTLAGVLFSSNSAFTGGGIWNGNSSAPSLNGVTFTGNRAGNGGGMYNSLSSPSLTEVTFSGNEATVDGGGMVNGGSSPTLINVLFSGNTAAGDGGGMFSGMVLGAESSPTLIDVTFSSNGGANGGGMSNQGGTPTLMGVTFDGNIANTGGGMSNLSSTPTLINVLISGNSANFNGGGMANTNSSPSLTNVVFSGNSAADNGGGMANGNNSDAVLINVTFRGNGATNIGGGMANYSSDPTLINVIMWDDSASAASEIYNSAATPGIAYSDVQGCGGSGSWDTACGTDNGDNIDSDPSFIDPDGVDNTPGTPDDDLRLTAGSPAIDAGDTVACPVADLDGLPRPIDGNGDSQMDCDMGAFEYQVATTMGMLSDAPDPSEPGQPFTVTFAVTATMGAATGSVTVTVGGDPATCSAGLSGGLGSCTLALSTPGSYTLTATYAGEGPYSPGSASERHTVEAPGFGLYLPVVLKND